MAQRSNKRQPVYSADTLALRYLAGLALAALGIIMFLAVVPRLEGNVFDALRQACYGLTGGFAPLFCALPVWAGVLVIWSAQRKAPVRPFLYASAGFLCLCGFIVLVTRIGGVQGLGGQECLQVLKDESDGSWTGVIVQGYIRSNQWRAGGGALGAALAFPLWTLTGPILGAAVLLLGTVFCALMAVNLTPARIRDLATGKAAFRWGGRKRDEEQMNQQIAFQRQQEMAAREQQMAAARQQEYIVRQTQQNMQNQAWPAAPAAGREAGAEVPGRGWTGTTPAVSQNSVLDWLDQSMVQAAADGTGRSRIFDQQPQAETPGAGSRIFDAQPKKTLSGSRIFDPRPETPAAQEKPRKSWILGRGRDQDDGLSSLSAEEKRAEGMAYPGTGRMKARAEAAGGAAAQRSAAGAGRTETPNGRIRAAREAVEEDLDRWRQPEAENPAFPAETVPRGEKEYARAGRPGSAARQGRETAAENPAGLRQPETMEPAFTAEAFPRGEGENAGEAPRKPAAEGRKPRERAAKETPERTPWQKQLDSVMGGGAPAAEEPPREEAKGKPADRPAAAPRTAVPVVQESIADPVWKPELKHVEPRAGEAEEEYWEPTPYYAPPITDLKKPEASVLDTSREDEERSRRLEATLNSFKVQARVVHVTHGPSISRFELELAPGTKVGKVAELERDIAYGMQATSVRIEAPIPGKGLVGVEVPNPKRATVTLREVLESPQMQNAKSILTVALGKDIAGTPIVCDLAKMPHMLIAGATGSGKSVCINTIINSLLFRAGPEEVKMILVDPKVVELQCYNGIPHLLLPVVNDPHKASAALAWAVAEMMDRYDKFSERGVRNLEGYNAVLKPGEKPMPRIVIIIDELADLMMVCKKDVEEYICRLTQLARAAGIHLIVATQRPSVDVITGLIKANIPSRIAFKTASYVDSRTILDRNGSEALLGWGDMLYLPTGSFAPTRIQGCFLSDEEVNRIADHVRAANPSAYDPDILDKLEQLSRGQEEGPGMDMIGGPQESGADSDLFEQAVEFAIADGQISTSTLQRRLKVGYARAGRLTDEMEERGIVSAKDGSKPRKCLITREQWEEMKASGEAS